MPTENSASKPRRLQNHIATIDRKILDYAPLKTSELKESKLKIKVKFHKPIRELHKDDENTALKTGHKLVQRERTVAKVIAYKYMKPGQFLARYANLPKGQEPTSADLYQIQSLDMKPIRNTKSTVRRGAKEFHVTIAESMGHFKTLMHKSCHFLENGIVV
jgi:hypothetical protein